MTRQIDEISRKIGALEAKAENTAKTAEEHRKESAENHKMLTDKLDEVIRLGLQTNGRVTANETAIADIVKNGGKLDAAYKNGKDWRETKLKAIGAMFGISAAGGSLGAYIMEVLGLGK